MNIAMKDEDHLTNNSFIPNGITESMKQFAEHYARSTNTYFCVDLEVTASVIIGLSKNKQIFGAPLCPCRFYDNKEDEITLAYWNCPCVPMRERKECHCMLFLTPENEFASQKQILVDTSHLKQEKKK
jgi:ferredoxin-thioredoxin reductase catalytic chain